MDLMIYISIMASCIFFPIAVSFTRTGFSLNTFFTAFSIVITIFVWSEILPIEAIIVVIVIIMVMLFEDRIGVPIE